MLFNLHECWFFLKHKETFVLFHDMDNKKIKNVLENVSPLHRVKTKVAAMVPEGGRKMTK